MAAIKRPSSLLSKLIILLTIAHGASALYKEQAGKYDWLKQHVGQVSIARFEGNSIYVASEAGAIAALHATDGSIAWRALLDADQKITALHVKDGIVVALTAPAHLRAFSSHRKGQLLWEVGLAAEEAQSCTGQAGLQPTVDGNNVIVACGPMVASYLLSSGRRAWKSTLTAPTGGVSSIFCDADTATIATIPRSGASIHIATVSAENGAVLTQTTASATNLNPTTAVALEGQAVALTTDGKVCASASGKASLLCTPVASLLPPGAGTDAGVTALRPGACKHSFVLQGPLSAGVMALEAGKVTSTFSAGGTIGVSCFRTGTSSGGGGDNDGSPTTSTIKAAVVARGTTHGLDIHAMSLLGGAPKWDVVDPSLLKTTADEWALLDVVSAFVSPNGHVLVQLQEGTLAYFEPNTTTSDSKNGVRKWVREEALSSVTDVLFAELPAPTPENEAQWAAAQPTTQENFQMQLLALKAQIGLANPWEVATVERFKAATSDRLRPTRDPDGFRKQLLVATAYGKVMSLHTGDGRVLWSIDLGGDTPPLRLAPWRSAHDLQADALIVAFRPRKGNANTNRRANAACQRR